MVHRDLSLSRRGLICRCHETIVRATLPRPTNNSMRLRMLAVIQTATSQSFLVAMLFAATAAATRLSRRAVNGPSATTAHDTGIVVPCVDRTQRSLGRFMVSATATAAGLQQFHLHGNVVSRGASAWDHSLSGGRGRRLCVRQRYAPPRWKTDTCESSCPTVLYHDILKLVVQMPGLWVKIVS
jgi:hypothetical protein